MLISYVYVSGIIGRKTDKTQTFQSQLKVFKDEQVPIWELKWYFFPSSLLAAHLEFALPDLNADDNPS